jgi:hypothetical protein
MSYNILILSLQLTLMLILLSSSMTWRWSWWRGGREKLRIRGIERRMRIWLRYKKLKSGKISPPYQYVLSCYECIKCIRRLLSCKQIAIAHLLHMSHETAICRKLHNSSNWDSCITRQFGYKHTFWQNVVSTTNFRKNIVCSSVGLVRIGQGFSCLP